MLSNTERSALYPVLNDCQDADEMEGKPFSWKECDRVLLTLPTPTTLAEHVTPMHHDHGNLHICMIARGVGGAFHDDQQQEQGTQASTGSGGMPLDWSFAVSGGA